jgi:hypothetical protein
MAPCISSSSPLMLDRWIYCNRADMHWYAMDEPTPPIHRNPHKQARFPDAPVRARTCASKLVAGAGVSGSSPLLGSSFSRDLQEKRKSGRTRSSPSYSNRTPTRAWLGTMLRPQEYIAYSLSRRIFGSPCISTWTSALRRSTKFTLGLRSVEA